jgi:hypothetical protein
VVLPMRWEQPRGWTSRRGAILDPSGSAGAGPAQGAHQGGSYNTKGGTVSVGLLLHLVRKSYVFVYEDQTGALHLVPLASRH